MASKMTTPSTAGNDPVETDQVVDTNKVIEIAALAHMKRRIKPDWWEVKAGAWVIDHDRESALAVIRALESSGFRLMQREATEEMVKAAAIDFMTTDGDRCTPASIKNAIDAAISAAPTYGTPPSPANDGER